jgi:hypothetical protein
MSTPLPIAQSGSQNPLSVSAIKKENQVSAYPSDSRNRKRSQPEVIDLEINPKKSASRNLPLVALFPKGTPRRSGKQDQLALHDPFDYSYECDYSTESQESQSHSSDSTTHRVKAESPSPNLSASSVNGKTSLVGYIVT